MNFKPTITRSHLRYNTLSPRKLVLILLSILSSTTCTQESRGHVMLLAALAGRTSDVEALISEGVPVDWKRGDGSTALIAAALGDHADTARF